MFCRKVKIGILYKYTLGLYWALSRAFPLVAFKTMVVGLPIPGTNSASLESHQSESQRVESDGCEG
jgi:hypothetical protein